MNETKRIMQDRIYDNRCPICDIPITATDKDNKVRVYKTIQDKNIALSGQPIKVCDTHVIEG